MCGVGEEEVTRGRVYRLYNASHQWRTKSVSHM